MEAKRSDRLQTECSEMLDKMIKLLEHQGNKERVFKMDKLLQVNIKMLEQEVRSDLLIGVTYTDKKALINLKARRERIIDEASKMSIINKSFHKDSKRDDEGACLLEAVDEEENQTIARLMNIKALAEGVKQKSQKIAIDLLKDTENIQSAIEKNEKIGHKLKLSERLVNTTLRLAMIHRIYLFLVIVLLALLDGSLLYFKLFCR